MHYADYLDVDRTGNGYVITVKHDVNKKKEPVDTVVKVVHLGKITSESVTIVYGDYPIWGRTHESGDIKSLK